jgi:hypothetical protein
MMTEKRVLALIALVAGLGAGILILLAATGGRSVDLLGLAAGIGVLYGTYLIYRGKSSLLFGWAKTRMGAFINIGIGILTLLVPGGIGGTPAILALVSGVLGLLAA